MAKRARRSPQGEDGLPRNPFVNLKKSCLFPLLRVVLGRRDDIGTTEPAVQVDIPAARRAERARGLRGRLAADRAGLELELELGLWLGLRFAAGAGPAGLFRRRQHSASRSGSG